MGERDCLSRVGEALCRYQVHSGTGLLAAVSGGRDSVVLLDCLCRLRETMGFSLYCAHVNHHIRKEAGEDAAFVEALCGARGIPFFLKDVDVPGYQRQAMVSPEAAARELRYRALEEVTAACGADWVLTAHHADDQTETVLLRLIRGASPGGLCGMAERRGSLLRPMLGITGAEIQSYARERGLSWREDCTNSDLSVPRNALRRCVIPALEVAHPGAGENIRRAAERFRRDEDFFALLTRPILEQADTHADGSRSLPTAALAGQPAAVVYRVLAEMTREEGVTEKHLASMYGLLGENRAGRQVFGPNGLRIQREHDMLLFTRERPTPTGGACRLQMGEFSLPDGRRVFCEEAAAGLSGVNLQFFDGDSLPEAAVFRRPEPGDWMIPLGMSGRKKLGDILTDAHYPRFSRAALWVLAEGSRILWIPELARIDESVKLTENSKRVLRMTLR